MSDVVSMIVIVSPHDSRTTVALLLPEHQHHPASMEWFTTRAGPSGWATCAVTELGVIRVCAQLPGGAWPAETTADRLLLLTATGRDYVFWHDAVSPAVMPEVRTASTGKQITDRYLLGLARRHSGRLITFDRALAVAGGHDVLCLSPAGR
ncbi:MAG TPA: PIN domain-containing protein [Galbitalea sp.]|nr:PIN domain-containing protein [Galbitalea sp.]